MKKILLILAVIVFISCKTERIYLIILPQDEIKTVTVKEDKYVIPYNRFSRKFNVSDSAFRVVSDKAMMSAMEKTKHLIQ